MVNNFGDLRRNAIAKPDQLTDIKYNARNLAELYLVPHEDFANMAYIKRCAETFNNIVSRKLQLLKFEEY